VSAILIFCNKRDFITEALYRISEQSNSFRITILSMEELMVGTGINHQFFENGTHTTVIKRLNGEEIHPDSFDLIFNRVNQFLIPGFFNRKDTAYASMEWLALLTSIYYSLKKKTINFNIQALFNSQIVNQILFLDLCRKNKIRIAPLFLSGIKKQKHNYTPQKKIERMLYLKHQIAGDTASPVKKKMIAVMEELTIDFAEIFFKDGNVISYNPFPAYCSDNEISFILKTFTSLIQKSN